MRKTQKVYYLDQHVKNTHANIVNINRETIELDRTIAYPEGGGQESDKCLITDIKTGNICEIGHVTRLYGTEVKLTDDHFVNVDGIILHHVSCKNSLSLDKLKKVEHTSKIPKP